ncbi:1-acyl-sn-glycerol-3-phosphate acyltransferase [Paraferrimonas sp. SM1919]|uniref:1-acyl-sn-glycerol-3-phosphate acyltransferase n=1 Tax=Paraferrimonas sp. SM1919 TaxID=2662263 RepID=UPI0013D81C62|nr:1-acyl-sn-glycerol-3-phosphate acyltransferase [Paraferrimonas sp. SM1919]
MKYIQKLFFPIEVKHPGKEINFDNNTHLAVFLNHSSFIEVILAGILPNRALKQLAQKLIIPIAAETATRPIGKLIRLIGPKILPISRRRDHSWHGFMNAIEEQDIMIFFPEGRMARRGGVDKHGKPMTMRRGIYDVLQAFKGKNMLLYYSGGFRHILPRGKYWPKFFKKSYGKVEIINVDEYLAKFESYKDSAQAICEDLLTRKQNYLDSLKLR